MVSFPPLSRVWFRIIIWLWIQVPSQEFAGAFSHALSRHQLTHESSATTVPARRWVTVINRCRIVSVSQQHQVCLAWALYKQFTSAVRNRSSDIVHVDVAIEKLVASQRFDAQRAVFSHIMFYLLFFLAQLAFFLVQSFAHGISHLLFLVAETCFFSLLVISLQSFRFSFFAFSLFALQHCSSRFSPVRVLFRLLFLLANSPTAFI